MSVDNESGEKAFLYKNILKVDFRVELKNNRMIDIRELKFKDNNILIEYYNFTGDGNVARMILDKDELDLFIRGLQGVQTITT